MGGDDDDDDGGAMGNALGGMKGMGVSYLDEMLLH